jgi:hypothetical protein
MNLPQSHRVTESQRIQTTTPSHLESLDAQSRSIGSWAPVSLNPYTSQPCASSSTRSASVMSIRSRSPRITRAISSANTASISSSKASWWWR